MKSSALSLLGAVGSLVLFAALTAQNLSQTSSAGLGDWPMAGANPQRTSWGQATVDSVRGVQWYRPIEAYIDQKTQIIAASRKIYVATTKGLIVLDAETGSGPLWRFDTELPLNTPAVVNGAVYVAGYDRKLYALNADTGALLWTFTGAEAGYSTNPLVVNNTVYIGNRDGKFYAVRASTGGSAWSQPFQTGGPIMYSAAYNNGVLYFASQDMHAYAINASSGALAWKSPQKLPGEQYQSWWPVIYKDLVIFTATLGYKDGKSPGVDSMSESGSNYNEKESVAFYGRDASGNPLNRGTSGHIVPAAQNGGAYGWETGVGLLNTTSTDAGTISLRSYITQYPSRRTMVALSQSNGTEQYALPYLYTGTRSGNRYPAIVDLNGDAAYANNHYSYDGIARAQLMGWKAGNNYLKLSGNRTFAIDEPTAYSGAGSSILFNLCCDREAGVLNSNQALFWSYSAGTLDGVLPADDTNSSQYDPMWRFYNGAEELERLKGYYKGSTSSRNGVYHNHGLQNPLVPYAFANAAGARVERLFTHRSNTIIALGPNANQTFLPLVFVNSSPANRGSTLTTDQLTARLERELQKMVDLYLANPANGFLRPGYYNDGIVYSAFPTGFYFEDSADTLYTLASAYPYVTNSTLKQNLANYLRAYFTRYFVTQLVKKIGWSSGQPRESMVYPTEIAARMNSIGDTINGNISLPQRIFYAGWKYAQLFPSEALNVYNALRPGLVYPPAVASDTLTRAPYTYNDYIAGYRGFINLYDMARPGTDATLRTNVESQLNSLLSSRTQQFSKDHPWLGTADNPAGIQVNQYARKYNLSRNFLYLTPELGQYMAQSARSADILAAINEYTYLGPFWFAGRNENTFQEGVMHPLYDSVALFAAKAYIARQPLSELSKYIDTPAFNVGDLFYIQSITATLQSSGSTSPPPPPPPPPPTPNPDVTAPAISGISVTNLASSSATIGWATNEASDTQVEYGVTTSYGQSTSLNTSLVTTHTAVLSNLSAGTLYHYRARSRDAAGNLTLSGDRAFTTQPSGQTGALLIGNVTDNRSSYANSQVPKYEKLEITFQVSGSVAANFQMPYDPNPPAGIPAHLGISVNAEFSQDNFQTVQRIPAFYYQDFDYQVKGNRDWLAARDQYFWKVRFAPPREGTWRYRVTASDASGAVTSPTQNFTAGTSANKGFVRVSARDRRYFEFEDGSFFPGLGYNNAGIDWFSSNPITSTQSKYQTMNQNGVQLTRMWLSQAAIYGSAWNPWYGLRGDYGGYIPRTGLTPFAGPTGSRVKLRLSYAEDGSGNKNTGYFEACRFLGGFQAATAIKRNAGYHFRVKFRAFDITGPRNASFPNYGFVLKMQNPANGNWHGNCYEPGTNNSTGMIISPYSGNTSDFTFLEGDWNSGSNDFLPPFYMALENVRALNPATGRPPSVYVESVEIRERLANGTLTGPNLVSKPSMEHHLYFEQRNSYVFDRVVELAKRNDVYLKPVILEKDEDILNWIDGAGNFGATNSNNFYGNYRNVTAARWLQQAWWRYLQARWGYSTSIHSWELLNEGNPASDRHYTLADELGKYMRQFAPNHHLVTTSFWHSLPASAFWKNSNYPNVDYADLHAYVSTSQTSEFNITSAKDAVVRARCGTDNTCFKNSMKDDAALNHSEHSLQAKDRNLGKPLVRGETGLDFPLQQTEDPNLARDTNGVWLHNLLWSSLDSGGMYDHYWWTENLRRRPGPDGSTANGLHEVFKPLKDFMANIPLNNSNYQDVAAAVSNGNEVRALGQKDLVNKRAHIWVQNRKHTWCAVVGAVSTCPSAWDNSRLSGTVTISGFTANTAYSVQWWNFDNAGALARPSPSTITADASGNIMFNLNTLPATVTDAAATIGDSASTSTPPPPALASDTTAPTLSGIVAAGVTASGASITWTTNEASSTQVEYGVTTGYGSSTALVSTTVMSHSAQLAGLQAATLYHYRVRSQDGAGNLAMSGDLTFTTAAGPIVLPAAGTRANPSPGAIFLMPVIEDFNFRTNLGINNLSPSTANAGIILVDKEGIVLASKAVQVEPAGLKQINHVVRYLYNDSTEAIQGNLYIESDQPLNAWAAQIDNISGDPSLLSGKRTGASKVLIPSAANISGFTSSLVVMNLGFSQAQVSLKAFGTDGSVLGQTSSPLSIPSNGILSFENILQALGVTNNYGTIEISSLNDVPIIASSRVSSTTRTGGFFEGLNYGDASLVQIIPHVVDTAELRTNIGINNVSDSLATVRIRLIDKNGVELGMNLTTVAPKGLTQLNHAIRQLMNRPGLSNLEGYIRLESDRPIFGWASQIDNLTNDPGFAASRSQGLNRILVQSATNVGSFRSSLVVVNVGATDALVDVVSRNVDGNIQGQLKDLLIPATGFFSTSNILENLGVSLSFGPLEVTSINGQPLMVTSRVYSSSRTGSFFEGQPLD